VHATASGPCLLVADGIPAEGGHRERIQLASADDIDHVVTPSHPLLARHRLAPAAAEALVDLVAQGTVDEGSPTVTLATWVYATGSSGGPTGDGRRSSRPGSTRVKTF
jgi:hypothetical protein